VYFARPTIAIAKIRDYSQSNLYLVHKTTMAYLNGILTDKNSLAAFTKSSGETSYDKKTLIQTKWK